MSPRAGTCCSCSKAGFAPTSFETEDYVAVHGPGRRGLGVALIPT